MSFKPCFGSYFPEWVRADSNIIRLSIFHITGLCVGFPALLWTNRILYLHYKQKSKISPFAIFLLLSVLLELILNSFILTCMVIQHTVPCMYLKLLFGARLCGYDFHQLVVVECILIKKYKFLAVIFSQTWCDILCIFIWLVAIVCQLIPNYLIYKINICFIVLPVIVSAITYSVSFFGTDQVTDRKPDMTVISVALFTLIILYLPYLLTFFTTFPLILDPLASMRLISEPLLCALICKEKNLV